MLNEQVSENEALVLLNIDRTKIIELEEKLLELWKIHQDPKNKEIVVNVNVQKIYYQLQLFLRIRNNSLE